MSISSDIIILPTGDEVSVRQMMDDLKQIGNSTAKSFLEMLSGLDFTGSESSLVSTSKHRPRMEQFSIRGTPERFMDFLGRMRAHQGKYVTTFAPVFTVDELTYLNNAAAMRAVENLEEVDPDTADTKGRRTKRMDNNITMIMPHVFRPEEEKTYEAGVKAHEEEFNGIVDELGALLNTLIYQQLKPARPGREERRIS